MDPVLAGLADLRCRSRLCELAWRSALISEDLPVFGTPTTINISGSAPPVLMRGALPPLSRMERADSTEGGDGADEAAEVIPGCAVDVQAVRVVGEGSPATEVGRGGALLVNRGECRCTSFTTAAISSLMPSPLRVDISRTESPRWLTMAARCASEIRSILLRATIRRSCRPVSRSARSRWAAAEETGTRASRTSMTKSTFARR